MNRNIKIGIISVDINTPMFNYGAILHTWAFEKYLDSIGYCNYENIDYLPEILVRQNRKYPMFDLLTNTHKRISLLYTLHYFEYLKKYRKMMHFFNTEMVNSKKQYTYRNINKVPLNYDILIAEDDVIWAPSFLCKSEFVDKTFFLAHDNMKNIKKVSYSASMAECDFNEKDFNKLKDYLSRFAHISVRESYAKDFIIEKLCLKADMVLDAVFLLDKEQYDCITSDRFKKEGKYVLLYLPADDNNELRLAAKEYACENNAKILEVSNKVHSYKNVIGDCGVEDFLSSIKYADVIFTNSFHALCFSLIFEKEFFTFSRAKGGKIKDLCERLDIGYRYFPDKYTKCETKLDYERINRTLSKERQYSQQWLLNVLEE